MCNGAPLFPSGRPAIKHRLRRPLLCLSFLRHPLRFPFSILLLFGPPFSIFHPFRSSFLISFSFHSPFPITSRALFCVPYTFSNLQNNSQNEYASVISFSKFYVCLLTPGAWRLVTSSVLPRNTESRMEQRVNDGRYFACSLRPRGSEVLCSATLDT